MGTECDPTSALSRTSVNVVHSRLGSPVLSSHVFQKFQFYPLTDSIIDLDFISSDFYLNIFYLII